MAQLIPNGFAAAERDHVRSRVHPTFEWLVYEQPSPRQRLQSPLERARVALVGTAGAHLPDQPLFARGREGGCVVPADSRR